MTRIGILAGGGRLPLMIAESVAARGDGVHIVAIEGEADPEIARFPHTWVNWGQIGRMVATLRAEGATELVIAGGVTRPDLWRIRPDVGFFTSLPQIVRLLAGGDDSVLTRVVRFFEGKGLTVRGVHEVAPDLLAGAGRMGGVDLRAQDRADAELGFAVRQALGAVDAGQAVVVAHGKVLAIEGAEGTDAMLQRVAGLPGREAAGVRRGVLAKGPKPGQELRVDMPAIGPRTVEQAAAAGLAGVVVEAGVVLVLDRAEAIRAADAAGCALYGLEPARSAGRRAANAADRPRDRPLQRRAGAMPATSRRASRPCRLWPRSAPARAWWSCATTSWRSRRPRVRWPCSSVRRAAAVGCALAQGRACWCAVPRTRARRRACSRRSWPRRRRRSVRAWPWSAPRTRSGPTRRPRGWRTAMACSWCCARYHEGYAARRTDCP